MKNLANMDFDLGTSLKNLIVIDHPLSESLNQQTDRPDTSGSVAKVRIPVAGSIEGATAKIEGVSQ